MKEKITFYLKNPSASEATLVYAFLHFRNQVFKVSAGIKIHPKDWNRRKHRVKASATHAVLINSHLDRIAETIAGIYLAQLATGELITVQGIRTRFLEAMRPMTEPKAERMNLFACYDQFLDQSATKLQRATCQVHQTTINHLGAFEKAYDVSVRFERIDRLFFEKFTTYLIRVGGLNNMTAWKIIKTFRAFLRHAVEHGYTDNTEYLRFTQKMMPKGEKSDQVYLTMEEFQRVMTLDLSDSPRLDRSRDLFVLQAHTGLRYSDVLKLRPEHVQGDSIRLVTQKNRKSIGIPLLPAARVILEKYGGVLPVISNQKQNLYLKELMRRAEIDSPIVTVDYRGAERIEKILPKHELIGTHSAKRTFVTLLRQRGVSIEAIMRVTGNTRRTIETYILTTENDVMKEIESAWT